MSTQNRETHLDEERLAALALGASADGDENGDREARRHLGSCQTCRDEVAAHRALLSELDALAPSAPSAPAMDALKVRVLASIAAEPPSFPVPQPDLRTGLAVLAVAVGGFLILGDDAAGVRWALAIGVAGLAAALATARASSDRQALARIGAALLVSVGLAAYDVLAVDAHVGEHHACEKVIALTALLPLASALLYARAARGLSASSRALRGALGGSAAALAGQAMLLTTCSSPEGLLHVATFHVLAVVCATAAGGLLGRLVRAATA